jgi:multidrug resistance efflux pump
MDTPETDVANLVERELDLVAREAELNRRETAVRRAEELREGDALRLTFLDRRERELDQMREALEAQRGRLDEVRAEYEERRDVLRRRTLELEAERDKLRELQARLRADHIEDGDAALAAVSPVEAGPDWWAHQLGKPLEAA